MVKLQPMGANNLNTFRKDFAKAAGLGIDKRITSHGAKKILVQRLQDSNVFPIEIVQMISHKNLQFINNYSSLGESQQMAISTLLSTACSSTSVSQRLQSQTVLQPVIPHNFSATLVLQLPLVRWSRKVHKGRSLGDFECWKVRKAAKKLSGL